MTAPGNGLSPICKTHNDKIAVGSSHKVRATTKRNVRVHLAVRKKTNTAASKNGSDQSRNAITFRTLRIASAPADHWQGAIRQFDGQIYSC